MHGNGTYVDYVHRNIMKAKELMATHAHMVEQMHTLIAIHAYMVEQMHALI